MENASKALIMAAGMLIGILILTLAVYLFTTFGASSALMYKEIETNRLSEFNSRFTSYEEKDNITIYDVVTVANMATENNKYYELVKRGNAKQNDYYIKVMLDGTSIEFGKGNDSNYVIEYYNNKIKTSLNDSELSKYKCKTEINETTGRVWKIIFIKI